MNIFYDTNYDNKINNPKLNDFISSCIISEKERKGSSIKIIQILRQGMIEYETIYEKYIDKVYTTEKNNIVTTRDEQIKCCKQLSSDEITCIFSFIAYDKKALEIFNEYLKARTLNVEKKEEKVTDKQIVKKVFEFEEFVETINNPYNSYIQSFYVETKKGINIYERNIKIKMNDEWRSIYYTLFDDYTTISEMVMELNEEQIEMIKSFISNRSLKEFEIYLKRCNKHVNPIKK